METEREKERWNVRAGEMASERYRPGQAGEAGTEREVEGGCARPQLFKRGGAR